MFLKELVHQGYLGTHKRNKHHHCMVGRLHQNIDEAELRGDIKARRIIPVLSVEIFLLEKAT